MGTNLPLETGGCVTRDLHAVIFRNGVRWMETPRDPLPPTSIMVDLARKQRHLWTMRSMTSLWVKSKNDFDRSGNKGHQPAERAIGTASVSDQASGSNEPTQT